MTDVYGTQEQKISELSRDNLTEINRQILIFSGSF